MFRASTSEQSAGLADLSLSPFQRRRLAGSWVFPFREHILPLIDEQSFSSFYHPTHGAPNRSVRVVLGILLLKEFFDLTDHEALEHFAFDLRWQIALDVVGASVSCCQKTLHNFRTNLRDHDKEQQVFEDLTDQLCQLLGLDHSHQRLDSTHTKSDFATRTRLGILCETIRLFLRHLQRHRAEDFQTLPEQLWRRYLTDPSRKSRYEGTDTDRVRRRLPVVARDLFRLVQRFAEHPQIKQWSSYAALRRVSSEQCENTDTPVQPAPDDDDVALGAVPIQVRQAKEVPSDSMQSPHDPDATYGKKGQGYEVQVCETIGNSSEADPDKPELITYVEVTPSCSNDIHVTIPVIENLKERGLQPEKLEVDAGFSSSPVVRQAEQLGTQINGPVKGNKPLPKPDEVTVGDFQVDVDNPQNSRCPAGHTPTTQRGTEVKKRESEASTDGAQPEGKQAVAAGAEDADAAAGSGPDSSSGHNCASTTEVGSKRISLVLVAAVCASCVLSEKCPAEAGKGKQAGMRVVRTTEDELLAEQRRRKQTTAEYAEDYRWRAGIEGTNSEMKRRHGLGDLRVRGREQVELAVYLKAAACNIKRVVHYLGKQTTKAVPESNTSPAPPLDSSCVRSATVLPEHQTNPNPPCENRSNLAC